MHGHDRLLPVLLSLMVLALLLLLNHARLVPRALRLLVSHRVPLLDGTCWLLGSLVLL